MPRSCFSPSKKLYDTCYAPETLHNNETHPNLSKGQANWQKLSWLYFKEHTLNSRKPDFLKLSEQDLAENFHATYYRKKKIPKVCVEIIQHRDLLFWDITENPKAQLHHIYPKRLALKIPSGLDPDSDPINIIPLSPIFHVGDFYHSTSIPRSLNDYRYETTNKFPFIHPDQRVAWFESKEYGWKNAFEHLDECRNQAIQDFGFYHNNIWDTFLQTISEERYYIFANMFQGFTYPQREDSVLN